MNELKPRDHAEEVATHRHAVIGPLCSRELTRGDLAATLRELSEVRFRAPGADITRTYSVPTLERWYYAYRAQGLIGLAPRGRCDRGRGRKLTPALKTLICDIRREYPSASAKLIVRTLEADGRLERGLVKHGTVQKFLKQRGLDRIAVRDGAGATTRLRWQASAPDALWHADVCHGPTLTFGTMRTPIRVHGMLDDCSRYIVGLEAHDSETELDMLRVFIRALRTHGRPDVLYLDNGSTYRGDVLRTACARLGISLVHAQPYDPEARGKMERFWRTLREGCLNHLGTIGSLDELNQKLRVFLERHYHPEPHAGLLGRVPSTVYAPSQRTPHYVDEAALRQALLVRARRRVRRDTTVSIGGHIYELHQGFLAGRVVDVAYSLLDDPIAPVVEYEGRRYPLHALDPENNARIKRPLKNPAHDPAKAPVAFDPSRTLESIKSIDNDEEDLDASR
jgi:transposase InsO family protein